MRILPFNDPLSQLIHRLPIRDVLIQYSMPGPARIARVIVPPQRLGA